jgi:hypothetical protein
VRSCVHYPGNWPTRWPSGWSRSAG